MKQPAALILFFLSLIFSEYVSAQTPAGKFCLLDLDTWIFPSNEVGRNFKLYISYPSGYDSTNKEHPVLYMTDGDWNMTVARNCFSMLKQDYPITEPIIVGIGYGDEPNRRAEDMDRKKNADVFFRFIQNEVFPFVEKRYSVNKERALYGHSMGGHFASYVLFRYPGAFQKILIGAPPHQLGNLKNDAVEFFSKNDSLKADVFVGVGSYETEVVKNINEFETYLKQNNHGIRAGFRITPDAGHGAGIAQVMEDAIAFAYCKKHIPVTLPKKELQSFQGNYANDRNPSYIIKITFSEEKLFLNDPIYGINEIIPCGENKFYMQVNETFEILFEKNKMYSLHPERKIGFTKK